MMIDFVRKRKKGLINFILLGLAVILMISFGLESFMVKSRNQAPAITIDGEDISREEYDHKLRSVEQLYSNQFKGAFEQIKASLNLPQKIADQMIEERLLAKYLSKLGLTASVSQIEDRVAQLPYFGGKMDQESFNSYLQATGLSGAALEASITKEIIEGELLTAFGQLNSPSLEELKAIYSAQEQQARFVAAKFSAKMFEDKAVVAPEELQKYYDEHKQEFLLPKEVELEYVFLSPSKYSEKVVVQDVDARQLYEEKQGQFVEPEKVLLSKIFFLKEEEKPKSEADENQSKISPNDKKQQLAQSVIERVKKGENFDLVANELSEKLETGGEGGSIDIIGWKKLSELNDDVKAGLEEVPAGSTSGIIEDGNEIAVYFVKQRTKERELAFEEVKDKLVAELKAADAPMYLEAEAEKRFSELQSSNESLADFSKKEGATYQDLKNINEKNSSIPKKLRDEALLADKNSLGQISAEDGVYFYKVIAITPERAKTFEETKDEITKRLKLKNAAVEARQKAGEFLKAALTISDESVFKSKVTEAGAEVVDTSLKPLNEQKAAFASGIDGLAPLYTLSQAKPVYTKTVEKLGESFIVMLVEKKEPDFTQFEKKKTELAAAESKKIGSRLLASLVSSLRAGSKIEINPEILQSVES